QRIEKDLVELTPQDEVALFTFGDRLQTVVGFDDEVSENKTNRLDVIRTRLRSLKPTWSTTDLGIALVTLANELDTSTDAKQSHAEPQIVVVSDFQKSSRLESLQAYEWPESVKVIAHSLAPKDTTNSFAHLLENLEDEETTEWRVRVANSSDSS